MTATAYDELAFAGPAALAGLVRAREVHPRELVELFLRRIEAVDSKLNAFRVTLAEQALAEAGRDPDDLKVQAPLRIVMGDTGRPDVARSMATVPELFAAGATDVIVTLRAFARDVADAPAVMKELAARFRDHR